MGPTGRWGMLALVLLALGCGDDDMAPFAPDHDGGRVTEPPGSTRRDAGTDGAVPDGAVPTDAGVAFCVPIAADDEDTFLEVVQVGATEPFVLRNAYVRWNDVVCDPARLLIGLTDGACLPGVGQQLLLTIDADAIGSSVVIGDNVLSMDTTLRVQFSRPAADAPDEREVFGTCAAGTDGVVSISALGVDAVRRAGRRGRLRSGGHQRRLRPGAAGDARSGLSLGSQAHRRPQVRRSTHSTPRSRTSTRSDHQPDSGARVAVPSDRVRVESRSARAGADEGSS